MGTMNGSAMSIKYFSINKAGYSIRCKLFYNDLASVSQAVLCAHGFGGNKENKAVEWLARQVLSKRNDAALLAFDWPCHGEDGREILSLEDCDRYLTLVIGYARDELGVQTFYAYGTSFGAYLILKYISEHENPFRRIALRSAAVRMYSILEDGTMTQEEIEAMNKGKCVFIGFHRKVGITKPFADSLREADITNRSYEKYSDSILMIHGTKDELVPMGPVEAFAAENHIPFFPIENADHRFVDPGKAAAAANAVVRFFWPA